MSILQALFLGVLQGITEFLPISSSGHLVIAQTFLGLEVDSLKSFDVVVHLGTLTAIIIYFWKDIVGLLKGFLGFLRIYKVKPSDKKYQNLILYIVVATIPAVIVGLLFEDAIDDLFRNAFYVGIWMIIVGVIFIISEKRLKTYLLKKKIGYLSATIIGIMQAFALIPGVSRSGTTISAGIFQGLTREKAARFSFLLAVPVILGAGILTVMNEISRGGFELEISLLLTGFASSALAGFCAVYFLMKYLKKHTLKAFSYYLFLVGGLVIILPLL